MARTFSLEMTQLQNVVFTCFLLRLAHSKKSNMSGLSNLSKLGLDMDQMDVEDWRL